jgi:hypothetical protein
MSLWTSVEVMAMIVVWQATKQNDEKGEEAT